MSNFFILINELEKLFIINQIGDTDEFGYELFTRVASQNQANEIVRRLQQHGFRPAITNHIARAEVNQLKTHYSFPKGHRVNVGRVHGIRMRYNCSRARKGKPSNSAGWKWFHNPITDQSGRFKTAPAGWRPGRGSEWKDNAKIFIRRRWSSVPDARL